MFDLKEIDDMCKKLLKISKFEFLNNKKSEILELVDYSVFANSPKETLLFFKSKKKKSELQTISLSDFLLNYKKQNIKFFYVEEINV